MTSETLDTQNCGKSGQILEHTYGDRTEDNPTGKCPLCPGEHGGPGPCDHRLDRRKRRRYDLVPWHIEELLTAFYNPDPKAASAVKARQAQERHTLPSRHICSCVCPNVAHGRQACAACRRLQINAKPQEAVEIGRTRAVHPPSPSAEMLDLLAGLL